MTAEDPVPPASPLFLLVASCLSQELDTVYSFLCTLEPPARLVTKAMTSELKGTGSSVGAETRYALCPVCRWPGSPETGF